MAMLPAAAAAARRAPPIQVPVQGNCTGLTCCLGCCGGSVHIEGAKTQDVVEAVSRYFAPAGQDLAMVGADALFMKISDKKSQLSPQEQLRIRGSITSGEVEEINRGAPEVMRLLQMIAQRLFPGKIPMPASPHSSLARRGSFALPASDLIEGAVLLFEKPLFRITHRDGKEETFDRVKLKRLFQELCSDVVEPETTRLTDIFEEAVVKGEFPKISTQYLELWVYLILKGAGHAPAYPRHFEASREVSRVRVFTRRGSADLDEEGTAVELQFRITDTMDVAEAKRIASLVHEGCRLAGVVRMSHDSLLVACRMMAKAAGYNPDKGEFTEQMGEAFRELEEMVRKRSAPPPFSCLLPQGTWILQQPLARTCVVRSKKG